MLRGVTTFIDNYVVTSQLTRSGLLLRIDFASSYPRLCTSVVESCDNRISRQVAQCTRTMILHMYDEVYVTSTQGRGVYVLRLAIDSDKYNYALKHAQRRDIKLYIVIIIQIHVLRSTACFVFPPSRECPILSFSLFLSHSLTDFSETWTKLSTQLLRRLPHLDVNTL